MFRRDEGTPGHCRYRGLWPKSNMNLPWRKTKPTLTALGTKTAIGSWHVFFPGTGKHNQQSEEESRNLHDSWHKNAPVTELVNSGVLHTTLSRCRSHQ